MHSSSWRGVITTSDKSMLAVVQITTIEPSEPGLSEWSGVGQSKVVWEPGDIVETNVGKIQIAGYSILNTTFRIHFVGVDDFMG